MSRALPEEIPRLPVALVVGFLLVSFAAAVVVAQLFLWLVMVLALVGFALGCYLLYLFYRLVVAVERLADAF